MNFDKKNKIGTPRGSSFSRMEKLHPITKLAYVVMLGIGVLFMFLIIAFLQTNFFNNQKISISIPQFFSLSTIFLLIGSYTIQKTRRFYKKDNLNKLKKYLLFTIGLGLAFIGAQLAGFQEMATNAEQFTGLATETYIYLITALHTLHVLGGFIFLLFIYFKAYQAASDAIRTLVYIRNPFVKQQIKLLSYYWHFMVALWLLIFVLFLFTLPK